VKTFDEACLATFARTINRGAGEDEDAISRKLFKDIEAEAGRWMPLAADIQTSELVANYVATLMAMVANGEIQLGYALMTCFIQGTIVGVEMERSAPPIAGDSVPGRRERQGYTGV
jgi:hypothetical protein